ncbi:MAG: single-stranded DNA-binding protein [Microbacterium sp.]
MSEVITVVGNITQPELRTTQNGVPILSFRIASTARRFDKGEDRWVDGATNWYSVSVFRRLAEHASRSLRKGDRVVVTGRLRLRDWETALKKGVTAEIDADALGHDLLWGMTTFHRSGGAAGEQQSDARESAEAAWTAPGTDPGGTPTTGWPIVASGGTANESGGTAHESGGTAHELGGTTQPDDRRQLVGASGETPF